MNGPSRWIGFVPTWIAVVTVIAAVVVVTIHHADRSAFYDESWVVEYARAASLSDGLQMAYRDQQPIAIGYLALLHGVSQVAGDWVWVYRLPSAIFAAATLLISGWLAARWCGWGTLGFAVGLLLLACPLWQRYASEIKQYLPAAGLTVGLIAATECWAQSRCKYSAWIWLVTAVAVLLLSFAGWFAVAGCGGVVFMGWLVRGRRREVILTVIFGVVIALVAGTVHLGFNRHVSGSGVLADYWSELFLPRDASWIWAAWRMGGEFFEQAWYRYAVPGWALMLASLLGWGLWVWRQPIAGLAAGATVGFTLIANTMGLWPLGVRVNLHLVTIAHLCLLAGPMVGLGWALQKSGLAGRRADGMEAVSDPSSATGRAGSPGTVPWLLWVGLVPLGAMVAAVAYESRDADYEVAAIGKLLDRLAVETTPLDHVLMTPAAYVNYQMWGRALPVEPARAPWPIIGAVARQYDPLMQSLTAKRILLAVGHHNQPMAVVWRELGQALSPRGRFQLIWSDRLVAIYQFTSAYDSRAEPGRNVAAPISE